MLVLSLDFFGGRYHATPWRHNVNEGIVEWPPSNWRIMRALVSSWKKARPEESLDEARSVIEKLAASPPSYKLPPMVEGHTRHYMPQSGNETKLVYDQFASLAGPIYVIYDNVELNNEEKTILTEILGSMNYLGRAESMCTAQIDENEHEANCAPCGDDAAGETVEVLVPSEARITDHEELQEDGCWEISSRKGKESEDKTKCIGSISITSKVLHDLKLAVPGGARFVRYSITRPERPGAHIKEAHVQVFRYALGGAILPSITKTVHMGRLARVSSMSRYRRTANTDIPTAVFSGRDPDGTPMKGHRHAYFIPTCENNRQSRLDHLTIITREKFGPKEQDALRSLRYLNDGTTNLTCLYQAEGELGGFDIPSLGRGNVWVSATPFVPARHTNHGHRARHSIEDHVRHLLELTHPNCAVRNVTCTTGPVGSPGLRPSAFAINRGNGNRAGYTAYSVRIEFEVVYDAAVEGPLALGYGAHYGLGLFIPERRA